MAEVHATLDKPFQEAVAATRVVGAEQGYALVGAEIGPNVVALKKGTSLFSWGSALIVEFTALSPTSTGLKITTKETFAITDWGRGKRAAQALLDTLGAMPAEPGGG